jgi:ABC-type nitrate/sulfonate/bicarbonate transport system permease component
MNPGMLGRRLAGWLAWAAQQYAPALALLVGLVFLWEGWVRAFDTKDYILPAPSAIWAAFLDTADLLPAHARTTMTEAIAGLLIAAGAGVVLSILLASIPLVRRVLYPLLVVSQTIPMIVLAPLLIIWFGFGLTPKIVVVALIGFFPIVVATTDALLRADPDMVGLVRSMGGNRLQVLRHVLIPGATPAFFSGMQIAAAYAVTGAVIGEWIGASSGLGLFIERSRTSFQTDQVFVAVIVVALASLGLFAAVNVAARLASPWMYSHQTEEER